MPWCSFFTGLKKVRHRRVSSIGVLTCFNQLRKKRNRISPIPFRLLKPVHRDQDRVERLLLCLLLTFWLAGALHVGFGFQLLQLFSGGGFLWNAPGPSTHACKKVGIPPVKPRDFSNMAA